MFGWVGEVSAVSETAGDTRRRRTASGTSSCRYCHLTVLRSPRSCYAVGICRYCDLTVLRSPRSWYAVFVLFLPTTHYPPLLTL